MSNSDQLCFAVLTHTQGGLSRSVYVLMPGLRSDSTFEVSPDEAALALSRFCLGCTEERYEI